MKKIITCSLLVILYSCSSTKTATPSADIIYMSTDKAPLDCKFVGNINDLHETFTSGINSHLGKNMAQGHIRAAKDLGANYIKMNEDQTGEAYTCPNSELSKINQYNWN